DIFRVSHHPPYVAHDLGLQPCHLGSAGGGDTCLALLTLLNGPDMADIEPRRGHFLAQLAAVAQWAGQQPAFALRFIIVVRTEPAFEYMAMFSLEVINFECHEKDMGPNKQVSSGRNSYRRGTASSSRRVWACRGRAST